MLYLVRLKAVRHFAWQQTFGGDNCHSPSVFILICSFSPVFNIFSFAGDKTYFGRVVMSVDRKFLCLFVAKTFDEKYN